MANAIVAVVAIGVGVGPIVVAIVLDARQSRFRSDVARDIALLTDGPSPVDPFAGRALWAVLTVDGQGSSPCKCGSRVAAHRSGWRRNASSWHMPVVLIQASDRPGMPSRQLNDGGRHAQPRDLQPGEPQPGDPQRRVTEASRVPECRLRRVRALLALNEPSIGQLAFAAQGLRDAHILDAQEPAS